MAGIGTGEEGKKRKKEGWLAGDSPGGVVEGWCVLTAGRVRPEGEIFPSVEKVGRVVRMQHEVCASSEALCTGWPLCLHGQ